MRKEASSICLILVISITWLSSVSGAIPDNNSIVSGNFTNSDYPNNSIITGAIGGIIGAIFGSLLTYYSSSRLLTKRLEKENAVKFLTGHYLPLFGMLEWTVFAWYIWISDETYKEELRLSKEESCHIFIEYLSKLSQTLESTMNSGANIILYRIDKEIYNNIVALDYLLRDCLDKISHYQNLNNENIIENINKVTPLIENVHINLSEIGMPKLIEEYKKIMKDKTILNDQKS